MMFLWYDISYHMILSYDLKLREQLLKEQLFQICINVFIKKMNFFFSLQQQLKACVKITSVNILLLMQIYQDGG